MKVDTLQQSALVVGANDAKSARELIHVIGHNTVSNHGLYPEFSNTLACIRSTFLHARWVFVDEADCAFGYGAKSHDHHHRGVLLYYFLHHRGFFELHIALSKAAKIGILVRIIFEKYPG